MINLIRYVMVVAATCDVGRNTPADPAGGRVSSAAEMIARLSQASQKLDEARAKTVAATQDVTEARTLVAAALEGADPGPLIGVIDAYGQALTQAAQNVGPVRQHLQETITRAQSLGN
ncbi:DUF6244 family protein [Micromonospora sp. WMMD882]|uniref:DUF6244 family protein n=1 Tax=Micromonospora sp. WMMD882 TaxID=3015151 RepID=UPI00248AF712|nr:DUF6244 family protein [Micromonospora sp. WMMD882]WBB80068.1 DUF6244 family protein [Micromonospora sp. WMMD882]